MAALRNAQSTPCVARSTSNSPFAGENCYKGSEFKPLVLYDTLLVVTLQGVGSRPQEAALIGYPGSLVA